GEAMPGQERSRLARDDAAARPTADAGSTEAPAGAVGRATARSESPRRDRPTIRDVARAAGVGGGTGSRGLSGPPAGAEATPRRRIREAMERLGYQPSPAARALSRGRTQTLEILLPAFTHYFYVEIMRGIEEALGDSDYSLLVRTIMGPHDRDRAFAGLGRRGRADGFLIASLTPSPELVDRVAAQTLPVVLVDNEHPRLPSV